MQPALDFGIPVILSHAGGSDVKRHSEPFDDWYADLWDYKRTYKNNDNFIEMMASAKNESEWCLFGDMSSLTMEKNFRHFDAFYGPDKKHFNYRMVYGSDYPFSAIRAHYPVEDLIKNNLLDSSLAVTARRDIQLQPAGL